MGRKKGYEREALVASALGVFHRQGFKGASTEVLVRELGVNRNSVYSEFGSKEGLFAAALSHYDALVVSQLFGPLEAQSANLDDIATLFHVFSESVSASIGLGCLMCNTAAELGGNDPDLQPSIDRYFERLHIAFSNALSGAVRDGQISNDTAIGMEARFLTSCCLGIFLMVRAGIGISAAQDAVRGALNHLGLLRRSGFGHAASGTA
jgi:TetR/AcrR family transcriptional repressor of nem operon